MTTLLVLALVTALATTVTALTINNLQSSWRAQQAGAALNAAEAGVAQAVTYLRGSGVRGLQCSPTCPGNAWGNSTTPQHGTVAGSSDLQYDVWIGKENVDAATRMGVYVIHSRGAAPGGARRDIEVRVEVTGEEVPRGVVVRSLSAGGKTSSIRGQSVFSTGCVYQRSHLNMIGKDLWFDIPAAVHSSQYITEANGGKNVQYCTLDADANHRRKTQGQSHVARPCNVNYMFDQDRAGGALVDTPCADATQPYSDYYAARDLDHDGTADVEGSWIEDDLALRSLFGLLDGLSAEQLDDLRTVALSQDNYWTSSRGWRNPDEADAVMFFDLAAEDFGGTVDLNDVVHNPPMDGVCPAGSLVIVIVGGNAKLNSNTALTASLFLPSPAPNGRIDKANGSSEFTGTMYADQIDLSGTADIEVEPCFVKNTSPALLEVTTSDYRELDRG